MNKIKISDDDARPDVIRLPLSPNHLHYHYVGSGRRNLRASEQTFLINRKPAVFRHHPMSLHASRTKKARPRVQLTEEHVKKLRLPIIDETSKDITKVVFPNGRANYIILARRDSKCPALRAVHGCLGGHRGMELDQFLSTLDQNRQLKDELGGGRYIASGFGNMGRNVPSWVRPPTQPALRKCLKFTEHHQLAQITGDILSHVSECIARHFHEVYEVNQKIMETNPKLAWPPLEYQTSKWKWMSSQFIVRRWGPGLAESSDWPMEKTIVAAHTDQGDLDTFMPHCYRTGGGKDGLGGEVAGTDLAVFEHEMGGAGYRVKTCMRDIVVIVILRSNRQLHGCIKSASDSVEDDGTWSSRLIPFIPKGVFDWMVSHPTEPAFDEIP